MEPIVIALLVFHLLAAHSKHILKHKMVLPYQITPYHSKTCRYDISNPASHGPRVTYTLKAALWPTVRLGHQT